MALLGEGDGEGSQPRLVRRVQGTDPPCVEALGAQGGKQPSPGHQRHAGLYCQRPRPGGSRRLRIGGERCKPFQRGGDRDEPSGDQTAPRPHPRGDHHLQVGHLPRCAAGALRSEKGWGPPAGRVSRHEDDVP